MKALRLLPDILHDIAAAAEWYDENGYGGLGERFIDVFYGYVPKIQQHGEIYRVIYRDFRKVLLQPFPYILYYRLHEDTWVIALVIHAARDPGVTRKLLNRRRSL
ncbi:MAG: type II toxin-antitoxin system RelE/ParE family toxin [Luteolibacter sp.]